MNYEAVLFDLDGTLVDSGNLVAASVQRTFEDFGLPVPEKEAVISYMGIPIEIYFEELGGEAFKQLNASDTYSVYFDHFKEMLDAGMLVPFYGVTDMLRDIKETGIYTGIATSKKSDPAKDTCKAAGISDYIDIIIGSDLTAAYKPAPDTVYKCLEMLGVECGKNVLVVGDAEADLGMGNSAGAATCGVTWGAHDAARLSNQNPDYIVSAVDELRDVIGI